MIIEQVVGPDCKMLSHTDNRGVERMAVMTYRNPDATTDIKAAMEAKGWTFTEVNILPLMISVENGLETQHPGPFLVYFFQKSPLFSVDS